MGNELDWSGYRDQGQGDAYADIPKRGGDFAKAVAVCIRSGNCERDNPKGVMCPSFRLQGRPEQSPGGRVKLLKQALNGSGEWLDDGAVAAAMDSCVACKGCKRECESHVDMALIKTEYLGQQWRRSGGKLRDRLFASAPGWLYRWPLLGRLIGWRNRAPWLRRLGDRWLGIAAQADLPQPAVRPFTTARFWYEPVAVSNGRELILWVDSFTGLFDPAQVRDALTLLTSAGFRVGVVAPQAGGPAPRLDGGRMALSIGQIDEARRQAQRLVAELKPHIDAGRLVIGLEPAALLLLRDEYLVLGLGREAQALAASALLFEEFIAREIQAGCWPLQFRTAPAKLLVHGHCHAKATGALKSLRRVLRLVEGLQFSFIEASCCGMAGSYGLEAEHWQESRAMAERGLLPALAAEPEAAIIAGGFACGCQIRNLSGRKPVALASLLAAALVVPTAI